MARLGRQRGRRRGAAVVSSAISILLLGNLVFGVLDLILSLAYATDVQAVAARAGQLSEAGAAPAVIAEEAPSIAKLGRDIAVTRETCYPDMAAFRSDSPAACTSGSSVIVYSVEGTRTWLSPIFRNITDDVAQTYTATVVHARGP